MLDRRSCKVRLWIVVLALLTLSLGVYAHLGTAFLSSDHLTRALAILFPPAHPANPAQTITTPKTNDEIRPSGSMPKEGFVTFSNNGSVYSGLLIPLLDSIHYFSTRPVFVFGIDIDLDINLTKYPRVIQRRISKSDCGRSTFFCKIHAIIESKLDYGVQIDADSLVNWDIDILFDVLRRWPHAFPLAPRHPGDPHNYDGFLAAFNVVKAKRTIPYTHAQFSWTYRAYPFFKELRELMRQNNFLGANYDESAMNTMLWRANVKHTFCKIDPYTMYFTEYMQQAKNCSQFCHTAFLILHGSKLKNHTMNVLSQLKRFKGAPYIQTKDHGFHYPNETDFTCCYPDSKPSAIHPLICEYSQYFP